MVRPFEPGSAPFSLDVVWCRFPLSEMPRQPGPKFRPGLVRSVRQSRDQQRVLVEVAYGTSRLYGMEPGGLLIEAEDELAACGLIVPTCFPLARCVSLPWADAFFGTRMTGKGPIIGHLPVSAVERLRVIVASPAR